jgi:hypothetical protein
MRFSGVAWRRPTSANIRFERAKVWENDEKSRWERGLEGNSHMARSLAKARRSSGRDVRRLKGRLYDREGGFQCWGAGDSGQVRAHPGERLPVDPGCDGPAWQAVARGLRTPRVVYFALRRRGSHARGHGVSICP